MENPYPISVDNTLKRNQNVDNYSMRNFRDINVQFLNLFLIAGESIIGMEKILESCYDEKGLNHVVAPYLDFLVCKNEKYGGNTDGKTISRNL